MDEKKVEEAIERISEIRNRYNATLNSLPESARRKSDYNNDVVAFDIAIEALGKQLPRKPKETGDFFSYCKCPKCEKIVPLYSEYCYECGQRLDWNKVWKS